MTAMLTFSRFKFPHVHHLNITYSNLQVNLRLIGMPVLQIFGHKPTNIIHDKNLSWCWCCMKRKRITEGHLILTRSLCQMSWQSILQNLIRHITYIILHTYHKTYIYCTFFISTFLLIFDKRSWCFWNTDVP